jgi:hypothetical protein
MQIKYIIVLLIIILLFFTYINSINKVEGMANIQDSLGFIVLRHVNSEDTNKIWIKCIQQIRKSYPTIKIVIIDDNSNYDYIVYDESILNNCIVIDSTYKGRGELLPYYYFYKNHWFDKAIFIHDSVFINSNIDTDNVKDIKFLWHFNGGESDNSIYIEQLLSFLNHSAELLSLFKNKNKWTGCFGVMSVIDYNYLKHIVDKYNIFILLDHVTTREGRMACERIFALINYLENYDISSPSIFGYIYDNSNINIRNSFKYNYEEYVEDEYKNKINNKINKILCGR